MCLMTNLLLTRYKTCSSILDEWQALTLAFIPILGHYIAMKYIYLILASRYYLAIQRLCSNMTYINRVRVSPARQINAEEGFKVNQRKWNRILHQLLQKQKSDLRRLFRYDVVRLISNSIGTCIIKLGAYNFFFRNEHCTHQSAMV